MTIFWFIIFLMTCVALGILVLPFVQQKSIKIIGILIIALPVLSFSLYWILGAHQKVAELQQSEAARTEIEQLGSLDNVIRALELKVAAKPDAAGFALLGRLYLKNQAFKEAATAFLKANQLKPQQVEVLIGYAESIYFMRQGTLTTQARQLLQQALQLQPNQPDALNLLAMDAYARGDYAAALKAWQQVLPQLAEGSEAQQKLLQMMALAQKKLKSP